MVFAESGGYVEANDGNNPLRRGVGEGERIALLSFQFSNCFHDKIKNEIVLIGRLALLEVSLERIFALKLSNIHWQRFTNESLPGRVSTERARRERVIHVVRNSILFVLLATNQGRKKSTKFLLLEQCLI